MSLVIPNNAADFKTNLGLGNVADLDAGTSAGNVVQLDGSGALPAVDGSNLTGLSSAGANSPVFFARYTGGSRSLTSTAVYDLDWLDTTDINQDSCFNTSTGVFTPNVAGKYMVFGQVHMDCGGSNFVSAYIYLRKNGGNFAYADNVENLANGNENSVYISAIVDMNGTTDYLNLACLVATNNGANGNNIGSRSPFYYTYFGGFRLNV